MKRNQRLKTLVFCAVLVAVQVVLSRFLSVNAWNTKIGFGFVPVVLAAALFGVRSGALVGAMGDFLGAILFPIGPYFPGFTITLGVTGVVFGVALQKPTMLRIVLAALFDQLVLSLVLNSYWISVLYGSPYWGVLTSRIFQCAITLPMEIVVTAALVKMLPRLRKQV